MGTVPSHWSPPLDVPWCPSAVGEGKKVRGKSTQKLPVTPSHPNPTHPNHNPTLSSLENDVIVLNMAPYSTQHCSSSGSGWVSYPGERSVTSPMGAVSSPVGTTTVFHTKYGLRSRSLGWGQGHWSEVKVTALRSRSLRWGQGHWAEVKVTNRVTKRRFLSQRLQFSKKGDALTPHFLVSKEAILFSIPVSVETPIICPLKRSHTLTECWERCQRNSWSWCGRENYFWPYITTTSTSIGFFSQLSRYE